MTEQKPKPLFPAEIPPIQLPILSIEEPAERVTPTPVPVVLPLGTIKGGTAYVAQLLRILPLKMVYQILISEEKIRQYDLSIGSEYLAEVSIPEKFREGEGALVAWIESVVVYDILGTKYDGYSKADVLAVGGYKYDGYSKSSVSA